MCIKINLFNNVYVRGMPFTVLWSSWSGGASRLLTVGLGLEGCGLGLDLGLGNSGLGLEGFGLDLGLGNSGLGLEGCGLGHWQQWSWS